MRIRSGPIRFNLYGLAGLVAVFVALFGATLNGEEQKVAASAAKNATLAYVGTFTGAKSKGIYLFRLRTESDENSRNDTLVPLGLAAETPNPSFLELDLKRRLLFAVNEIATFEGKPTGAISSFSIERGTGKLTLLNQR